MELYHEIRCKPYKYWVFMKINDHKTGRFYTSQLAAGTADKRCQSTPVINHCHCSNVTKKHASLTLGQMKWPLCKRRWHNQTPVPSQTTTLMRLPERLRKTNADPEQSGCPKACWTIIDKPSIPRRMSTGETANQIAAGFVINPDIVRAQLTSEEKCCSAVPMRSLWITLAK
jgi:hypothetical protein